VVKRVRFLLVPCLLFFFMQCHRGHKHGECLMPPIKDTTLYFQTDFTYTIDSIPGGLKPEDFYTDTVARVNVLYKGLDSCYYLKNIKIGMRDKQWEFVEIPSTNIARIEAVCTDSGMQFVQTRQFISNEMMTTLDTTRIRIPGKIFDGKLQLKGVFYSDTALISANSANELLSIFSAEANIDSMYTRIIRVM